MGAHRKSLEDAVGEESHTGVTSKAPPYTAAGPGVYPTFDHPLT